MTIFYLALLVYLAGLPIAMRKFLRYYLTWWEDRSRAGLFADIHVFGDATPHIRTVFSSFVWPPVFVWKLLTYGVKSEQQEAKERRDAEVKAQRERDEFKRKAKDMNIPGWEQLP